jgi:hypothetical protein
MCNLFEDMGIAAGKASTTIWDAIFGKRLKI